MATETIAMTKITHDLLVLHRQRATGELVITCGQQSTRQWRLYFYLGRLVYATGGVHSARRWYRALKYHCPEFYKSGWLDQAQSKQELWEVDLINQAVDQGQISAAQAKTIIQSIVQEVMFAVVEQKVLTSQWESGKQIAQQIAFLSIEQVIQQAQHLRKEWCAAGLGSLQELLPQFSPDLAPVLRNPPKLESKVSAGTYKSLLKLMKGRLTLWDVAHEMQRPLPNVIRALLPMIRHGVVALQEIPDLSPPCFRPAPTVPMGMRPLIACIDDSPTISQAIANILEPAGYQVLPILNPLQGISTLLEQKPALIFLDLVMPNTNGYELCTFLRKTSSFQNTPIVILTGHDGMIDRVRAKLAGSSEFLSKPPEAAKVLQVVQRFLGVLPTSIPPQPVTPMLPDDAIFIASSPQ
ncbi:MAG: response regulator [Oculatellaceae cyanobacterium Prado106]|jgi:chemotaxis family two-component system response regulator PixG|nr:response regulator [Oculatellaceae cyanobacterium Prado106]